MPSKVSSMPSENSSVSPSTNIQKPSLPPSFGKTLQPSSLPPTVPSTETKEPSSIPSTISSMPSEEPSKLPSRNASAPSSFPLFEQSMEPSSLSSFRASTETEDPLSNLLQSHLHRHRILPYHHQRILKSLLRCQVLEYPWSRQSYRPQTQVLFRKVLHLFLWQCFSLLLNHPLQSSKAWIQQPLYILLRLWSQRELMNLLLCHWLVLFNQCRRWYLLLSSVHFLYLQQLQILCHRISLVLCHHS